MQIKITMKYHFTPVIMVIIKKQEITSVGEDVENTLGGNENWCSHYEKK